MGKNEQGVNRERYMLIPRSLIFATRDERVLLIKGAAHKRLWANRYNGVGGHVERGEDVLTGARREFFEETGLSLINPRLCGVVTIDTGENVGIGIYVFRGECGEGQPVESKEGTLDWVDPVNLTNLPLVEDLFQLLPRVLSVKAGDPPIFAQYHYDKQDQLVVEFA